MELPATCGMEVCDGVARGIFSVPHQLDSKYLKQRLSSEMGVTLCIQHRVKYLEGGEIMILDRNNKVRIN